MYPDHAAPRRAVRTLLAQFPPSDIPHLSGGPSDGPCALYGMTAYPVIAYAGHTSHEGDRDEDHRARLRKGSPDRVSLLAGRSPRLAGPRRPAACGPAVALGAARPARRLGADPPPGGGEHPHRLGGRPGPGGLAGGRRRGLPRPGGGRRPAPPATG